MKKKRKKNIKKIKINYKLGSKCWTKLDKVTNNLSLSSWFTNSFTNTIENKDLAKIKILDQLENDQETHTKAKRVKLLPSSKQKNIFNDWFKVYRYAYNQTVKYFRKNSLIGFRKVRPIIKRIIRVKANDFIVKSRIPEHVLDQAIKDVCKAYTTCFSLLRMGFIKYFRVRYKKSSKTCDSIGLDDVVKNNTISPRVLGKKIESCDPFNKVSGCRLIHIKKLNLFYLYVPEKYTQTPKTNMNNIISLDPGIRIFLTGYSDKKAVELGKNMKILGDKIAKVHIYDNIKGKNKGYHKRIFKIKNMVDDLHWKTIHYLCNNYNNILLGNMSTKSILKSKTLNKRVKNTAQYMSFYKFSERLKYKCNYYKINYHLVDESYTSKTCGVCSTINENLGGHKIFACNVCNLVMDRDIHAARNILIKNIRKVNKIKLL